MPTGIDLILADHQTVNTLFDQFETDPSGVGVGLIIAALKAHDEAEQAALYPFAGAVLGELSLIDRSAAAHAAIKKQIDLIATLEGPPLVAAVGVLRQFVTKHVTDEETNLLPKLAAQATPEQLDALGARLIQAKHRGG